MRAWVAYAAVTLGLAVTGALVAWLVAPRAVASGIGFSAGLAWVLQLAAFGVLVRVRDRPQLFLAGWLGGMLARFGAVGVVAFWLTRTQVLPPAATLVALVAFVFVMLVLEPVFLRKGLPTG